MPAEVVSLRRLLPSGVALAAAAPGVVGVAGLEPADAAVTVADQVVVGPGDLHPAELALVAGADPARRREFVAGRRCAHEALAELGLAAGPILTRSDGSPGWPQGIRGSISHKPRLAVAAVAASTTVDGIGLDLEPATPLPPTVWSRAFTDRERGNLQTLEPVWARLAFCAKEAYYKWYRSAGSTGEPGFHDVEVELVGNRLRCRPVEPGALPTVEGRGVLGRDWLIAALWSSGDQRGHSAPESGAG